MKVRIAAVLTLLIAPDSFADSWSYEAKRATKTYEFGDVKIELTTDATKDRQWPLFELMIYKAGELQAKYRNVAFERIFASDDNEYFLGVSNCGVPGTAYVVFDSEGKLLQEVKHRFSGLEYSSRTATLERVWYNERNPKVEFEIEYAQLHSIHINTTVEGRVDLMGYAGRLSDRGIYRHGWPKMEREIFGEARRMLKQFQDSGVGPNVEVNDDESHTPLP